MSARIVRIALLVTLVLVLAGCSQSGTGIKIDTPSSSQKEPTVGPTPVSMGTRAWSGDWSVLVTRSRRKGTVAGVPAGKGNQLLVLDFEIHNGSTLNGDVSASSFALTDETRAEIGSVLVQDHKYVSNNPIAVSGGTKRLFTIVYRVPRNAGPFVWRFWPSVQGSQPEPAVLAVR